MSIENRQKIPVPRRSFLWSINESSGEVITHVGPTEFTPSANDRIVRANERGGLETAPQLEARPFIVARQGEYLVLSNPPKDEGSGEMPNGSYMPGGNKEKDLILGATRIIPGPCGFPLWPGQTAEVRQAHKLGANHYLLVEVVGPLDERSRFARLVTESAGLSSAVIDGGEMDGSQPRPAESAQAPRQLLLGQRIVIQGRHTPLFIPPTGIEVVSPIEELEGSGTRDNDESGLAALPPAIAQECTKLLTQVQAGLSSKQFSVMKNEIRHRPDMSSGEKAVLLTALDAAFEERGGKATKGRPDRGDSRNRSPADPYARRAVVLGAKEFCVLFDAEANARIVKGPARVFPGPYDTFLHRGSKRRVYDAFELAEHQALWLRIVSPIKREKLAQHLPPNFPLEREQYDPGHEFVVRGEPSVFFPFIEAEVVNPLTREPHVGNDHENVVINAIGIDQKSGIHVRDLLSGIVKMVRGERSYLVDPRNEEHVHRRAPREQWNLTVAHAEPHKASSEAFVTTPWALSVLIPNNEAVLITSPHKRRVEVGPKVVLLEYEEQLAALKLSKGPSKDGHATVTTCFLRVQGARAADTFEVESSDFVRFKIRLGFMGHFDGDPVTWFQAEDPVKLLADTARAKVREAARAETATRLLKDFPQIVRTSLLGQGGSMRFVENGMMIDSVDLLSVQILDVGLAQLFASTQQEAVKLQLQDEQAVRRLASARHQEALNAQEAALKADEAKRKSATGILEAESGHQVELRLLQLQGERDSLALEKRQQNDRKTLDFEVLSEKLVSESAAQKRLREAETEASARDYINGADQKHETAMSLVQRELAKALAEADAVRLGAIQRELVGALHAASDSEVMKAAANNMNLVSLLGGRSPAEILGQIVRGTPLERSHESMRNRSGKGSSAEDSGEEPRDELEPGIPGFPARGLSDFTPDRGRTRRPRSARSGPRRGLASVRRPRSPG